MHTVEPFIVTRLPWTEQAHCRGAAAGMFYLEQYQGSGNAARAVCAGCPVKEPCLQWALTGGPDGTGEHHGIWAGTTPRERTAMRNRRKRRKVIEHGTESGHAWHRRQGETPCDACRAAHSAANVRRAAS